MRRRGRTIRTEYRESRAMSSTPTPTPTTATATIDIASSHYPQLDGLRGLAILLVIVFHFSLMHAGFRGDDPGIFLQVAQLGWMGVDLFFVLSGFLITGILASARAQKHYFKNFLGRRFLRIWPLYYLSLLLLLVIAPLVMGKVPSELQGMQAKQTWFWLYATNWLFALEGGFSRTSGGYFWSLAVEEQFYVVWPFVVYALSDRSLLRVSLGLLGVSLVSRLVLTAFGVGTGVLYNMTFTHLDGLAVGACLSICLRSPVLTARVTRALPLAAAVALVGLLAARLADQHFFFWGRHMAMYGYTLIAILFGAMLVRVARGVTNKGLNRVLTTRFMTLCGKYSYALYLVHVPVASVLFPLAYRVLRHQQPLIGYDGTFLVGAVVAFATSWALAVASWFLIEKRILALKRYFVSSTAPPASISPVPSHGMGRP
ncbi:MAG: acyltransferase [Burkholderiales bacterium]